MRLKDLKTNFLGRNFIFYNKIDSTQSEIWRLVESDSIKNGMVVAADIQTSGYGTHGRKWYTDETGSIAISLFIHMDCNIKKLDGITIKIAQIILDILKTKYDIDLEIKEPNDIVYKGKKIGGILTETKLVSEQVKFLVVGIGINTSKEKFSDDINDVATSIKKELGVDIKTADFIAEFCNKFEEEILERMES